MEIQADLENFSSCLGRARDGCTEAMGQLFRRYFSRAVGHVRRQMVDGEARHIDEEEAVLSAWGSMMGRFQEGKYSSLDSEGEFWRLFAVIVERKLYRYRRREYGPTRSPSGPVLFVDQVDGDKSSIPAHPAIADSEPSPDAQAIATESLQFLLDHLSDDETKKVLLLRLEGFNITEIADQLKHSRNWVQRRCTMIRKVAESLLVDEKD